MSSLVKALAASAAVAAVAAASSPIFSCQNKNERSNGMNWGEIARARKNNRRAKICKRNRK